MPGGRGGWGKTPFPPNTHRHKHQHKAKNARPARYLFHPGRVLLAPRLERGPLHQPPLQVHQQLCVVLRGKDSGLRVKFQGSPERALKVHRQPDLMFFITFIQSRCSQYWRRVSLRLRMDDQVLSSK